MYCNSYSRLNIFKKVFIQAIIINMEVVMIDISFLTICQDIY